MSSKSTIRRLALLASALFLTSASPWAAHAQAITDFVLQFDGSEATNSFPGNCADKVTGYEVVGPIRVGTSGDYRYEDASVDFGIDGYLNVYDSVFDPLDTSANLVSGFVETMSGLQATPGFDDVGIIPLQVGTDYFLVFQELCGVGVSTPGAYAFSLFGPSSATGIGANPNAAFQGTFDGSEGLSTTADCGTDLLYDVVGPITVSASGTYTYHDVSTDYPTFGVDMTLAIYADAFDPGDPIGNRLDFQDDGGVFVLTAAQPYWLVAQPLCDNNLGLWDFLLVGPGVIEGRSPPVLFSDGFEPQEN